MFAMLELQIVVEYVFVSIGFTWEIEVLPLIYAPLLRHVKRLVRRGLIPFL